MKRRVVEYCRVSTDKDDQLNSLENQKDFFEDYINTNKDWEFVKIYADEGITGTSTKKRHQFDQIIQDAKNKKFDLILTKEISHFARNTVDTLTYTRDLKKNGIYVHFLLENLKTEDPTGEMLLSFLATIAQEESKKTSERVKFGHKQSMKNGVVFGNDVLSYELKERKINRK